MIPSLSCHCVNAMFTVAVHHLWQGREPTKKGTTVV